ncbi:MAG TPA: ABC transporter substrate-binding protein [Candidatus Dormibacteraeota bacterium]|nr:ABC transporter substrate-binding protein [Candidatus Dormibacteraeota bacterium]
MRRLFDRKLLGGLAVALLAACGGSSAVAGSQPNETHPVKLAFSAAVPQVQKVPTIMAMDALKAQGHDTSITYLQQSEDPVQAVVRGDDNFGSAATSTVFAAIAQGIPVKAILQAQRPDYVLEAPVSVTSPAGLDGLRVGIHAQVSSTALYTALVMQKYPNAKPKILVVPGSANRIRAMVAGQLDASMIQLPDLPTLDKLAPGKFHDIYDVAKERPDLIDAVIFTRTDLIASDPTLVKQFITASLQANRKVYTDVQGFASEIAKVVPNTTAEQAAVFAKLYTDSKVFPRDGGLLAADVQTILKALTDSGLLKQVPAASAAYDRGPLDEVLKAIGK